MGHAPVAGVVAAAPVHRTASATIVVAGVVRAGVGGRCRHGACPPAGVSREEAVVKEQIDPRLRNQGRQLLQELDGSEQQRAGAVAPRVREGAAHAAVREERQALPGERWTQKIVAERLQGGAIVSADGAVGVEIEAREVLRAGFARKTITCSNSRSRSARS